MVIVALVGALVGAGATVYGAQQQKKLSEEFLKAQERASFAHGQAAKTAVEILAITTLVGAGVFVIAKLAIMH